MKDIIIPIKPLDNDKYQQLISNLNFHKDKLAWYFSSGDDLRPITYLSFPEHFKNSKVIPSADIFLYSNLSIKGPCLLKNLEKNNVLFDDKMTKIEALDIIHCNLDDRISYQVSNKYFPFAHEYNRTTEAVSLPKVTVMKLRLTSHLYGEQIKYLIYFRMENWNFFQEIIQKFDLNPFFICGVREGWGADPSMNYHLCNEYIGTNDNFRPQYYITQLQLSSNKYSKVKFEKVGERIWERREWIDWFKVGLYQVQYAD
jgi:hypothetical protein